MAHESQEPLTVIIDPVSPEFNRGSFCYLPYLLYASMKTEKKAVLLLENFCAADVDLVPKADQYLIALWSHPQIEHVKTLVRFLPKGKVFVFGYNPLVEAELFPAKVVSGEEILRGMRRYHHHFHMFEQILLSDCDMHLQGLTGPVFPLFTSYGCPNQCAFCPSSANQPVRLALSVQTICGMLDEMKEMGHTNIHFTDEDFFFDPMRAHHIIRHLATLNETMKFPFQLIALAERRTLVEYLAKYGGGELVASGFQLIEVGLETASSSLSREMKKGGSAADCKQVACECPVPILWLTLTFFPGETLVTLRDTGKFLAQYGLHPNQLYPRIATNGTEGGLGQFFQPYEGTRLFEDIPKLGDVLTTRPLRLMPSFIPNSFKYCMITNAREVTATEKHWYELYRVEPPSLSQIQALKLPCEVQALAHCFDNSVDGYISLAISARLGVIE